jgi:hypothetical protein
MTKLQRKLDTEDDRLFWYQLEFAVAEAKKKWPKWLHEWVAVRDEEEAS